MAAPLRKQSGLFDGYAALPIYISGFLDLFGVSMILPLMLGHARNLGASPTLTGVFGSVYGAMQLFTSPVIGQWSDMAGRRFTLLICLLMSSCGYCMFGFATTMALLFLARLPLGIFKHSQSISKSYLADITPKAGQSAVLGHFSAASSIGFIVGPAVGGHIAELPGGFYWVSFLAAAVFLLNSVLIWLCTKEPEKHSSASLRRSESSATSLKKLQSDEINFNPTQFLADFKKIDWTELWDLFFLKFLLGASLLIFRSNFSLMLIQRFDTTPKLNGYIISFNGLFSALFGFLVGWIAKYYNNNAGIMLYLGALQVATLLILALAPTLWLFVAALVPLGLITTVMRVASTGLTIERGKGNKIGVLMGFSQSTMSVARMLAPLIAGLLQEVSPSGPGIVGACLTAVAVGIMLIRPQDSDIREKKQR